MLNSAICVNHFWVRPVGTLSQSVLHGRHFKHLIKAKRTSQLITHSIDGEFTVAGVKCLLRLSDFLNCGCAAFCSSKKNSKKHFFGIYTNSTAHSTFLLKQNSLGSFKKCFI